MPEKLLKTSVRIIANTAIVIMSGSQVVPIAPKFCAVVFKLSVTVWLIMLPLYLVSANLVSTVIPIPSIRPTSISIKTKLYREFSSIPLRFSLSFLSNLGFFSPAARICIVIVWFLHYLNLT